MNKAIFEIQAEFGQEGLHISPGSQAGDYPEHTKQYLHALFSRLKGLDQPAVFTFDTGFIKGLVEVTINIQAFIKVWVV